jgi:uncharacterized protein (TIGR02271 family)
MVSMQEATQLIGTTAYDADGVKVGKVGQVYLDDESGQPEWITVNTGLFGMNESFVPLGGAQVGPEGGLRLAFDKARIDDAPNVHPDGGHLPDAEEAELYRHYGLAYGDPRGVAVTSTTYGAADTTADVGGYSDAGRDTVGRDISGPTTDDAMTRSEERLRVGTEREQVGRARLRKYVVTENVQQTMPVTREEARIEREPITDENIDAATSGPDISSEEHEVTLHAERPVVEKETVPVERVRMTTDTVTDQETVGGEVRKEQIEAEGDAATRRPRQ